MNKFSRDVDDLRSRIQCPDGLKRRCMKIVSNLTFLDRVTQVIFMFGLFGIASFGVLFAFPYLYYEYGGSAILAVRCIGCFMAFQMFVNWLCMKFVDTRYDPVRDGTIPKGIGMGQNISRIIATDDTSVVKGNRNGNQVSLNKRKVGSLMYVASEMPKSADEGPKRTAYPYFSWTPCLRCNRPRPPRCHHCPQCNVCVLKRDHHCFFAGACIGHRNLRHFSVFLFWASVATIFSSLHALPYYYYHVIQDTRMFDLLFPVALARAAFGYICWKFALFITLSWILAVYLIWSISFLLSVIELIRLGKTTFEKDHKMELTDKRSLSEKLRSVYGHYWPLNFIVPLHFVFEPIEDPINWPHIQA